MTTQATGTDGGTPNPAAGTTAEGSTTPATGESLLATQNTNTQNTEGTAPAADGTASAQAAQENPDGKGKTGEEPVVPEKYEFTVPDGVELDSAAAEEFSAIAKELKLSQADAQRIADVATKMQQKQAEAHVEMVKGWADQCKTDKEFGGDNLQENLAVARKAIDTFGTPALKQLLNSTGMGNHPEVVRFVVKAGKAISEDGFVTSGSRTPTPPADSLEKRLYPNMN